ncbi:20549_t:CDS:2 [Cetraspora pellucida]|uniref:20549_t:CDS:1 n=1 Tax=Cetraspora pellucida TaxID=1433469 RepID=A0A9N9H1T3_9GLOM|nr:20549_t:CDS:2 [Cetraspora pellucida]
MEYYELCKLDETISLKKQNPFASKPPFRLGVAGTSESGKTKIVVRRSKNFGERYILCDDLIVVVQHQDEEL